MSNEKAGIPGIVQSKRPRQSNRQASTEEDRIAEEAQHLELDSSESQQGEDKKMTAGPVVPSKNKRKRKPPLVAWKKPKDMPRRPLSGYNIFFKEQRENILTMAREESGSKSKKAKKSPGIGFANLAKRIASKWKEIPPESRTPYKAQADIEKDRYNKEMLVWRAKQKDEKEKAEKEKARLTDDSQYTGVARREDIAAYSLAPRAYSSEARTDTWSRVAEAPRHPPSSYDQSSRSGHVARRSPAQPPYLHYGGLVSYSDVRSEQEGMYNPAIEYRHEEVEQPYRATRGGIQWGLDMHQGYERPVEVPRHFPEFSGTRPGSYPDTWFEVQQPREEEIDDQGGGKRPARKPGHDLSDSTVRKHHQTMRIHNVETPPRQLRAASAYSPILQHINPDVDAERRWRNRRNTQRAPTDPSHGMRERPFASELPLGNFMDPVTQQVRDIRSVEEIVTTDLARRHDRRASSDDVAPITQAPSSLEQLGTRLGTETVDFLTSLEFNNSSEESPSS